MVLKLELNCLKQGPVLEVPVKNKIFTLKLMFTLTYVTFEYEKGYE